MKNIVGKGICLQCYKKFNFIDFPSSCTDVLKRRLLEICCKEQFLLFQYNDYNYYKKSTFLYRDFQSLCQYVLRVVYFRLVVCYLLCPDYLTCQGDFNMIGMHVGFLASRFYHWQSVIIAYNNVVYMLSEYGNGMNDCEPL